MLKRKNKFLAIGLATVGAIGAASVAFATWLVGIQKTNEEVKLNVLVDNTQDMGISLRAVLAADQLKIAETTKHDNSNGNSIIGADLVGHASVDAMKFNFSQLEVEIGEGAGKTIDNVTITCKTDLKTTPTNRIQSREVKGGELKAHRTSTANLTYIELATITIPGTDFKADSTNTHLFKFDAAASQQDEKFQFSWGSFFDKKSPVNYYNDIYCNKTTSWDSLKTDIYTEAELDTEHKNIISELKDMDSYFKGLTSGITLQVHVNLK